MSISRLVDALFGLTPEQDHDRMRLIQRELVKSDLSADIILSEMIQRQAELNVNTEFYLLEVVKQTARPRHIASLLHLLSNPRVLMSQSRSTRSLILETLVRIGNRDIVDFLYHCRGKVSAIRYGRCVFERDLNCADFLDFTRTIETCLSRATRKKLSA